MKLGIVSKLRKGVLISSCDGFVDTFNAVVDWVADFCTGDGLAMKDNVLELQLYAGNGIRLDRAGGGITISVTSDGDDDSDKNGGSNPKSGGGNRRKGKSAGSTARVPTGKKNSEMPAIELGGGGTTNWYPVGGQSGNSGADGGTGGAVGGSGGAAINGDHYSAGSGGGCNDMSGDDIPNEDEGGSQNNGDDCNELNGW